MEAGTRSDLDLDAKEGSDPVGQRAVVILTHGGPFQLPRYTKIFPCTCFQLSFFLPARDSAVVQTSPELQSPLVVFVKASDCHYTTTSSATAVAAVADGTDAEHAVDRTRPNRY